MSITFPSNTKTQIDSMRLAIGRTVEFKVENKVDCPICVLDPITNTSSDPFCPTCSGYGYLITHSGYPVLAHITWGPIDYLNWVSGGQLSDGDCRIQIEYSVINLNLVDTAHTVVIDTKKMRITKKAFRGAKELNRIILDLDEEGSQ
jgi:hypothetical protein